MFRELFPSHKKDYKEESILYAQSICLERAKALNAVTQISIDLRIPFLEKEVFEKLLAVSILDKESKIENKFRNPASDLMQDPLSDILPKSLIFSLGYRTKETDRIALDRMKDQYKKELEALPSYSLLKIKDATLTAHLITTIYMQCMKEQGDLSDYFSKRLDFIKKHF